MEDHIYVCVQLLHCKQMVAEYKQNVPDPLHQPARTALSLPSANTFVQRCSRWSF